MNETVRGVSASTLVTLVAVAAFAAPVASNPEASFLAANHAAMEKMMTDMNSTASGNVDRDFAAMMIPHHQGAIEMARSELLYGHNEQLRRIAQEIIVDQQQEIAAMRLALNQAGSSTAPDHSSQREPD